MLMRLNPEKSDNGFRGSGREPGLAASLSFLFAGVGQIYARQLRKGVLFICIEVALFSFGLGVFLHPDGSLPLAIGLGVVFAFFHVFNCFDAAGPAESHSNQEARGTKDPWLAVFFSQCLPGLGHLYCRRWVIGIVLISLFIVAFVQQQALKDSVEILLASQALSALVVAAVCYHSFIAASGSATGRRRTLLKLTCAIAVAGILKFTFIYGFKRFLYEPYLVPTLSMESTLKRGDRVIVAHFQHGHVGERGDIIAYKVPGNQYQTHMSRLVGFGGDEIEIVGGKIQVNGNLLSGGPFDRIKYAPSDYNPESKFQVPPDSVFVLGDNVPNSKDSRYVGPIPARNVVGKVYKVYWPLARSGSTE